MGILREYTIWCDGRYSDAESGADLWCGWWEHVGAKTLAQARKNAVTKGWALTQGKWLCRSCQSELREVATKHDT